MINDKFTLFYVLYVYIAKKCENNLTESADLFLSDANPFIWENASWDSSIYDNFSILFDKYGTFDDNGYVFVIKYLEQLDDIYIDIKNMCLAINKDEYINSVNEILLHDISFYKNIYGLKK